MHSLATSLALARLDYLEYCNGVFFRHPAVQLHRLQSVQNSAARLTSNPHRTEHVSDALICMPPLRVAERIRYKMAVMTHLSLHRQTPFLLANFVPLSVLPGCASLRSASRRFVSKSLERDCRSRILGCRRLCMERSALLSQP
jgi:hypothetical protein